MSLQGHQLYKVFSLFIFTFYSWVQFVDVLIFQYRRWNRSYYCPKVSNQVNEWRTWYWRRCKSEENRSALFLLPDIGCGTHENVVEQKEAPLLSFNDFTTVAVDGLDHVIRTDQVAAAVTQKLVEQTVIYLDTLQGGEISAVQHTAQPDWGKHVSIQQRLQMHT